jgi:hypothetical protein
MERCKDLLKKYKMVTNGHIFKLITPWMCRESHVVSPYPHWEGSFHSQQQKLSSLSDINGGMKRHTELLDG